MAFPHLVAAFLMGPRIRIAALVFRPTKLSNLLVASVLHDGLEVGKTMQDIEFQPSGMLIPEESLARSTTPPPILQALEAISFERSLGSEKERKTHFSTTWRVVLAIMSPSTHYWSDSSWRNLVVECSNIPKSVIVDEVRTPRTDMRRKYVE